MPKVLYLSIFNNTHEMLLSNGVMRKINLHLECLQSYGNDVDYTFTNSKEIFLHHNGEDILIGKNNCKGYKYFNKMVILTQKTIRKMNISYDYIYIRHVAFSLKGFCALKYLSSITNCIYLEFPTFALPKKTIKNYVKYFFNKYIHRYIHKAVVDSLDEYAYGMKTLRITNGTDLSKIQTKKITVSETINVLLVAQIQKYHGIDKIIDAIKEYYLNGGNRNVVFHIVGDGPDLPNYKDEVILNKLEKHIIFYNNLHGEPLNKLYDLCEIGISSLSNKEVGVTCSSTLKSKEYLAKGLPIISDTMLDVFVGNPQYFFYVLENNFNFDELIRFYDNVYKNHDKNEIIKDIRSYAEKTCDMFKVFYGVHKDYLTFISK